MLGLFFKILFVIVYQLIEIPLPCLYYESADSKFGLPVVQN